MTNQCTEAVLTELAVPHQLLTEGIGLVALRILVNAAKCVLGITVILVGSFRRIRTDVVNTEVDVQLQPLGPTERILVRTKCHVGTDAGIVVV